MSITAGIRSRELCQAPINASVILSLSGVVGERLSFSNLQMKMQRRLQLDSNARLEATYRHSLIRRLARNDHGHRGRLDVIFKHYHWKFGCCNFRFNVNKWMPHSLDGRIFGVFVLLLDQVIFA